MAFAIIVAFVLQCPSFADTDGDADAWQELSGEVDLQDAVVAGNWRRTPEGLITDATRSSRLLLPYLPTTEYDFRVKFTRTSGVHSIALMFVSGRGQASFEVDAWGQHLAGLQMIGGQTLQVNPTRSGGHALVNGRSYTVMVQVRKDRVRAYLNGMLLSEHQTDGSDLSLPDVWRMPNRQSLGIGAYDAATTFHSIEVRPVRGGAALMASAPASRGQPSNTSARPSSTASSESIAKRAASSSHPRVLIVIANQDFFYREYHDPRVQLERAGIVVEVAAARKQICRPHANSGEQGSGEVMPDLAVADADASRYDAIMFSGGWGASMYQYAFQGSYANRAYNGDRQTKAAVNKLLNDFVKQDKYVGALCHGVSVLAWARIDGKSILDGKRAVASPRQSPVGIYNGQRGQPLSRWNSEVNGARLSPARSIGDARTSADDVLADGKVITGEDDNSAELFGATLAALLTER
ncbi:MAG: DJ-1/PfpI family protein [Planctomycetaceae bacterium]|nr:DJ-1/PfpI family protein [Planctomycetales bacterium]MCB9924465.1 DJ-1/PfpI family protein [Planctomycetaceae bacterium]